MIMNILAICVLDVTVMGAVGKVNGYGSVTTTSRLESHVERGTGFTWNL
jgi:hypothetical protein